MMPNNLTAEEKQGLSGRSEHDALLFECQCHGKHFMELSAWFDDEEWDDLREQWYRTGKWNEQWGEVSLVFMDHPTSFWSMLQSWWKHHKWWTVDIVLSPNDIKALMAKLKEFDDKYEQRKRDYETLRAFKPKSVAIPGFSDAAAGSADAAAA